MSGRTGRPKRAWLSPRSMGVMCVVLAVFVLANTTDRFRYQDVDSALVRGDPRSDRVNAISWERQRGFPWTYDREWHFIEVLDRERLDPEDVAEKGRWMTGEQPPTILKSTGYVLLNLAVALAVSVTLALVSERFVFSGIKRGRPPQRPEGVSSRTDRPKRALLSLKSMGVLCVVLAVFVWANTRIRCADIVGELPEAQKPIPGLSHLPPSRHRGFPWTCYREWFEYRAYWDYERDPARPILVVTGTRWRGIPEQSVIGPLLLNLAVALAVSVTLALVSERFVLSRLRRGPRPDTREDPK